MKQIINNVKQAGRITLLTILSVSIVMLSGGLYFATNSAQAAGLTAIRATLTSSAPSADSNWEIQFVTNTLVNENDVITLDFDTLGTLDEFSLTGIVEDDVDILEDTDGSPSTCSGTLTQEATAAAAAATDWGVAINTGTDTITLTAPTNAATYIAATACIVVRIGTNATSSGTGANQINNPAKVAAAGTADIYDLAIAFTGNSTNSGSALVAVVEGVTVSVSVDESLTFSIAGVASGSCTQGGAATAITTTVSTVPFGASGLSPETFYKGCHDIAVGTNAASGYTVSVQENRSLLSGTDTIDDTLCDAGDCSEVIAAGTTKTWATATNNGFGYTCSGSQCNAEFATAAEFNQFPCTGADAVCDGGTGAEAATTPISNAGATTAQTNRIIYKLSFDTVQQAGDYTNTITYIATPTF